MRSFKKNFQTSDFLMSSMGFFLEILLCYLIIVMLSDIDSPAFLFYLLNFGFVSLIMYYCYLFYSRLKLFD